MRHIPLASAALLLSLCLAQTAEAQYPRPPGGGRIDIYTDEAGLECQLTDDVTRVVELHFYHYEPGGPAGAQFRAVIPECWTGAVWAGDDFVWDLVIGHSQGDWVSMVYQGCASTNPVYLGWITIIAQGMSQPCCVYPVTGPEFNLGDVLTLECSGIELSSTGGSVVINPDETCECMGTVPVEQTSWGAIKAQYTD